MRHSVTSGRPIRVAAVRARARTSADGVADHASRLGERLRSIGWEYREVVVDWRGEGVISATVTLTRSLRRGELVVLHYSHLGWSRRGLPFGFLGVLALCRSRGRVVVWIHDPCLGDNRGFLRRFARGAKGLALYVATRMNQAVVTVDPAQIRWLRRSLLTRVAFCPSPSNVGKTKRVPPRDLFTVTCFGIGASGRDFEREALRQVASKVVQEIGVFRVRLLGAWLTEDRPSIVSDLETAGVVCDAPGWLATHAIRERLGASHAFLCLREGLSSRSGTLAAALACELPAVGFRSDETSHPTTDAGVIVTDKYDWDGIAESLISLARDEERQADLSRKSRLAYEQFFDWERVEAAFVDLVSR